MSTVSAHDDQVNLQFACGIPDFACRITYLHVNVRMVDAIDYGFVPHLLGRLLKRFFLERAVDHELAVGGALLQYHGERVPIPPMIKA